MAEFPVTAAKTALVDQFPRLSDFASQARKEGYSDQEIDDHVRQKFILPATKEGHGPEEINKFLGVNDQPSFMQKLAAGPVGAGIQNALGVLKQIGGTPEAATPQGVAESYKASQEKISEPMQRVFGAAGVPISQAVSGARAAAGAVTGPFIPRFVGEGVGAATELAGRGVGAASRAVGLPEPVSKLAENLTPDALTMALFGAASKAVPQGLQQPVNQLFKPREGPIPTPPAMEPAVPPPPRALPPPAEGRLNYQVTPEGVASQAPKRTIVDLVDEVKQDVKAQVIDELTQELRTGRNQAAAAAQPPRTARQLIEAPRQQIEPPKNPIYEVNPQGEAIPTSFRPLSREAIQPAPVEQLFAQPNPEGLKAGTSRAAEPRLEALDFMRKYQAEKAAKTAATPVEDILPKQAKPKVELPEEPPFDIPPAEAPPLQIPFVPRQKVFHGTSHEWQQNKPDITKVGTGEGGAAYGHGLYFAENPQVAKTYMGSNLAPVKRMATSGGKEFEISDLAGMAIEKRGVDAAIKDVQGRIDWENRSAAAMKRTAAVSQYEKELSNLNALKATGQPIKLSSMENIYQVNIPDEHIAKFLDWDKKLSEQPEALKAIKSIVGPLGQPEKWTGQEAYETIASHVGGAESASQNLVHLGIPGIKYLDKGSRQAGQGTRNFVVFDPKILEEPAKIGRAIPEAQPKAEVKPAANVEATARTVNEVVRGGSPEFPFEKSVQGVAQSLRDAVTTMEGLNERAKVTIPKAEEVATGGTFAEKPVRELFREQTGVKPETYSFKFSQKDIESGQAQVVATGRKLKSLLQDLQNRGDVLEQNVANLANIQLERAIAEANKSADLFKKQRFAAGRAVQQYNRAPVPKDVIDTFRSLGVVIDGLQNAKERLPIYTSILDKMKRIDSLAPLERTQLMRDFVDAFRLNLFSTTSWSLDFVGNAAEIASQTAGGLGRDLVHLAKGNPTFPSIQGVIRTIRDRKSLPLDVKEGLGQTIGGERIRGGFGSNWGTFTKRETPQSAGLDYLVGTPLYLKAATDTGAKRLSASTTLWRDAIEAADKAGLRGSDRQAFYQNFWEHPPAEAIKNAIGEGKKAGYDRVLTKWEESIGRSTTARLLVDAFARWPFQFTRWAGEMLGHNPELFSKIKAGTATAEDVGGYLAKTATGWGGLYMLDNLLYDHTDFNSMEYVHANGDRTRLSSRDPIPSALFLLAVIHGDVEKATGALRFASVPFAKVLVGEGGILGGLISQTTEAVKRGKIDPKGLQRETIDSVNRAIPGQAMLSAIKTVFDPTIREGVGANLPGVSNLLPAAINPSTGEPLQPRQSIGGLELPAIGGTPIPGARRILDPVTQVLSKYGLMVYRGPRSTIAGFPAGEVPADVNREWMQEFGKVRADRLGELLPKIAEFERQAPPEDMKPGKEGYEIMRREISKNDAITARIATQIVNDRHGVPPTPRERKPSIREQRGPGERSLNDLGIR